MKKNSQQLVDDLLSNRSDVNDSLSPEELATYIENNYEVNEEELQLALQDNRRRIEELVGVPITDEQLTQLAGGKSEPAAVRDLSESQRKGIGVYFVVLIK